MLLNTKHVGYYFRHPLMAVMLLWALTLPGQEVAVYSFLFHGTASGSALQLDAAPADDGQVAVQKQAVQAFEDARVSSYLVLDLPQLVKHPLLLLAFAAPADEPIPAFGRVRGSRAFSAAAACRHTAQCPLGKHFTFISV